MPNCEERKLVDAVESDMSSVRPCMPLILAHYMRRFSNLGSGRTVVADSLGPGVRRGPALGTSLEYEYIESRQKPQNAFLRSTDDKSSNDLINSTR